jgi:AraC-like DNA-binding protein
MSGYRAFAPRAALADFVHCVWIFTGPTDAAPQPIAPDGRCELIVHFGAPYRELRGHDAVTQPAMLFAGQLTAPLILQAQPDPGVIGVRFRPEAARAFLGADADAATNKRLDLAVLHGAAAVRVQRAARAASTPERAAEIVQDYAAARLRGARIDGDVRAACDAIFAERDAPARRAMSERQWQRRFKREVGVSARMLASIVRFRRVFDAVEQPEKPGWVKASLAAGYFDQPQMARDFRRFLGVTARRWAAQRAGLATALAAPERYKIG